MAYSLSKVYAVGRIGADAELRKAGDSQVCDVRFCANVYRGKNKDEAAVWYKVSVWGDFAEKIVGSLTKGSMVAVSGDLIVEEYEGRDGMRRDLVIVNADVVPLGDGPPRQSSGRGDSRRDDRGWQQGGRRDDRGTRGSASDGSPFGRTGGKDD